MKSLCLSSFCFAMLCSLLLQTACDKDESSVEEELAAVAATEEITPPSGNPESADGKVQDKDAGKEDEDGDEDKDEGEEKPQDALIEKGIALYAKNCESCHGALAVSEVRGKGAKEITDALIAVPEMKALGNLPSIDLASIAKALESGSGNGNGKGKDKEKDPAKGMEMKAEKSQGQGKGEGEGESEG